MVWVHRVTGVLGARYGIPTSTHSIWLCLLNRSAPHTLTPCYGMSIGKVCNMPSDGTDKQVAKTLAVLENLSWTWYGQHSAHSAPKEE